MTAENGKKEKKKYRFQCKSFMKSEKVDHDVSRLDCVNISLCIDQPVSEHMVQVKSLIYKYEITSRTCNVLAPKN